MTSDADFQRIDKKLEKLTKMADRIEEDVAPAICEAMRMYAVERIEALGAVDTGRLKNSVETAEDIIIREDDVTVAMGIETSVEYAKYIEFGTGSKGSNEWKGHVSEGVTFTSKEKWVTYNPDYQGDPGKNNDPRNNEVFGEEFVIPEFITRYPQEARPFLRPALYDNTELWKDLISGEIQELWDE